MTATDVLDLHTDILPVDLVLRKICQCMASRLASLLPSHPLHAPFQQRARRYIKKHRLPLHELAHTYGMAPGQMEMIAPVHLAPGKVLRCTTHISASVEDSVAYK